MDKEDLSLRFNYIKKKLKNHRVIIYGAGKFFQECLKEFDFSSLNIIGITDKKFIQEDRGKKFCGFPVILNSEFFINADLDAFVLLMLEKPSPMLYSLKAKGFKNYISFIDVSQSFWQKLSKKLKQKLVPKFIRKIFNNYIYIYGKKKNNTFVLIKRDGTKVYNPKIKNLIVNQYGQNSYIELHEPFNFMEKQCKINCASNTRVVIGPDTRFRTAKICLYPNCTLTIGGYTTFARDLFLLIYGGNTVSIGEDCMFSWEVLIRNNDCHAVYDLETKQSMNKPKDIIIKDHVWVGSRVTILKGAEIPSNTVVGINSVVNKPFKEENCVIAGIPAKVVKTNINWNRTSPQDFCVIDTVE